MSTQRVTVADLVAHPERIMDVDPADVPRLVAFLTSVAAALAARLLELPLDGNPKYPTDADDLLRIEDAAKRLNVSKTWLYRRVHQLPFVVRLDRGVRISAAGLDRYLRARQDRHIRP
jgi:excisionase family DNA binding protein